MGRGPVSSTVFRQVAIGGEAGKAERLFRAAVAGFCSLTRPSRREIAQLDDLTLPLFDCVPVEARRFAAAALSACKAAPQGLVRRLCDEPVEIAAPMLMRSPVLSDVDLIGLIGRHGLGHARAIGRRARLDPAIAALVTALLAQAETAAAPAGPDADARQGHRPDAGSARSAEEDVRARLRAMMQPRERAAESAPAPPPASPPATQRRAYERLRRAALSGVAGLYDTALADALAIPLAAARALTRGDSYAELMTGLKALDLALEEAFLVVCAIFPGQFGRVEAVRLFAERYAALEAAAARACVAGWCEPDETPGANGLRAS